MGQLLAHIGTGQSGQRAGKPGFYGRLRTGIVLYGRATRGP